MILFTDLFYALLVIVLGIADLWWVVLRTPTTARCLASYGWRVSAFPFACGVLLGRFVSAKTDPVNGDHLVAAALLVTIFWSVVCFHWFLRRWLELPSWFGLLYIPCGIPIGAFLWPV